MSDVAIRVTVQGREYALRVRDGAEAETQRIAAALDARIGAFRAAFPSQTELTAVLMTALALAEENHVLEGRSGADDGALAADLDALDADLARGLWASGEAER